MALLNNDLLVVQRVSDQNHYKVTIEDLEKYIEASPSVTFKGKVDLTDTATNNGVLPPSNGDMYVNTGDGSSDASWTGITAATPVNAGDRVLWDSDPDVWILISDAADPGGQVDSIVGQTPIVVDDSLVGSATAPVISILDATAPGEKGAVVIASDTDVANGTAGVVVTADQLKTTNDNISNAGGGTVTNVTGAAPIEVSNNSSTPVVSIADDAFAPYDFSALPAA